MVAHLSDSAQQFEKNLAIFLTLFNRYGTKYSNDSFTCDVDSAFACARGLRWTVRRDVRAERVTRDTTWLRDQGTHRAGVPYSFSEGAVMRVGLTYNVKSEFVLKPGDPPDLNAEFDHEETVQHIERALIEGGHRVVRIGSARRLLEQIGRASCRERVCQYV